MPIDPVFKASWKGKSFSRIEFEESIEKQLGRSDALLGELSCPWPPGEDAAQWQAGYDAERDSWQPEKKRKRS